MNDVTPEIYLIEKAERPSLLLEFDEAGFASYNSQRKIYGRFLFSLQEQKDMRAMDDETANARLRDGL